VADTGWGKAVWVSSTASGLPGPRSLCTTREVHGRENHACHGEISCHLVLCTTHHLPVHDSGDFSKYDLSALRYCTTAGEALEPAVFNEFYRLTGIKMMEASDKPRPP
jgi:acetyl-CoA synthetase